MNRIVVCCVDLGTTDIKAGLLDGECRTRALAVQRAPALASWEGFNSVDARAYAETVLQTLAEVMQTKPAEDCQVAAVAVTGQRATIVPIAPDNTPAGPALSWEDTSGTAHIRDFAERFGTERFRQRTGIGPIYALSLGRILRLQSLRPPPAFLERAVRFALLPDYVALVLGNRDLVTDPSHASATGLFDIASQDWCSELLSAGNLSRDQLPAIAWAGTRTGELSPEVAARTGLPEGIPLVQGGGDQQCAALGVGAGTAGEASLCLGTSAVVECSTQKTVVAGQGLYCQAHVVRGLRVLEAIQNTFGNCIEWAARFMQCSVPELYSAAAQSDPGARGILFFPYLLGIGSPDFDAGCSAAFAGLKLSHGREDMARAVIEGCCYEVRRALQAVAAEQEIVTIHASGNTLRNRLLVELLASVLQLPVLVHRDPHASLAGVAALAWAGVDPEAKHQKATMATVRDAALVEPGPDADAYAAVFERYCEKVTTVRLLAQAGDMS